MNISAMTKVGSVLHVGGVLNFGTPDEKKHTEANLQVLIFFLVIQIPYKDFLLYQEWKLIKNMKIKVHVYAKYWLSYKLFDKTLAIFFTLFKVSKFLLQNNKHLSFYWSFKNIDNKVLTYNRASFQQILVHNYKLSTIIKMFKMKNVLATNWNRMMKHDITLYFLHRFSEPPPQKVFQLVGAL